jgi:hypothetical protein
MTKFDLKKIIAENKATFFSSLDEGYDEFKRAEKGSKDVTAKDKGEEDVYGAGVEKGEEIEKEKLEEVSMSKEKIAKKIVNYFEIKPESLKKFEEFKLDGTDDIEELTNFVVSNSKPFPGKPLTLDQIQNTIEGFIKQATSTEPSSEDVYPTRTYAGREMKSRMDEEKTTMTKEALKTKIKEMILAELNEENIDVTNLNYDFLPEAKKEDEEATDAPEATDIEVSAEETPTSDSFEVSTSEVDPTIKAIQDALTQAQAAAQKLGDEKLTDQIGNTITFFTRTHVANKDVTPVAEQLDESFINKLKHRAGIIK